MRRIADHTTGDSRESLLNIAAEYDALADRAQGRVGDAEGS
jgi:hypothetical protein